MKKPAQKNQHDTDEPQVSGRILRAILTRGARGDRSAVVVFDRKSGKPSSVWGLEEYLARKELTKKVAPWKARRSAPAVVVDPLGAIEAKLVGAITRDEIYEE